MKIFKDFSFLNPYFLLIFLIILGIFLRFYNLMWGSPYFFHPDERNIAYAIAQLSFPYQLNPHFFAYGSLPIYVTFFTANFFSFLLKIPNDFSFTIFWLRFFSAALSCLSIFSLYVIAKKLINKQIALFVVFLSALNVGFIQYAHFGTFEMWITFFSIWLFYFSLKLSEKVTIYSVIATSLITGTLVAIKISNLTLIIFPLACFFLYYFKAPRKNILSTLINLAIFFLLIGIVYVISNPYVILDPTDFLGSLHYESSVALGTLPVFYTGSFFNTIPVIFQFIYVYPFLLNPLLTFLFIPAFLFVIFKSFKQKNNLYVLLTTYYLLLFCSQAFLFVKWTRYIVPTIPFVFLIIGIGVNQVARKYRVSLYILCCIVSIIFAVSFFKTVYVSSDTRVTAAQWAAEHLSSDIPIAAEPYDLGILPFNGHFPHITLVPSYDIDQNTQARNDFTQIVKNAQVFISSSQRLIHSRTYNKTIFPVGHAFYASLFQNRTAYQLVYQTPCDIFCDITYLGNPLYNVEETANVFDRPTVMIFEKK